MIINKVTAPRALGIACPFTGEALDVHLTVAGGRILYSCPHAFTLTEPVGSLAELQDRASMRNGMRGAADGVKDPVCPYLGTKLLLRKLPDGRYFYSGGFNPRQAFTQLDELLYYLTMRNGIPTRPKPTPLGPVAKPRSAPAQRRDARVQPTDATLEAMESVAAAHMQRGTMVSVSGRARGGASAKGKGK